MAVRILRTVMLLLALFGLAAGASAQAWRGQGHVNGKVTDEAGKPVEGVVVKLALPGESGGFEAKTNSRGEWSVGGMARGNWQVDFIKAGYDVRRISVRVEELSRIPPVETTLKKVADPNEIINADLTKANAFIAERKFAEAHQIYDALYAKYPMAHKILLSKARAYDLEQAYDREIQTFKLYLEKEPANTGVKLLAGSVMIANGNPDEGKQLLATVNDADVKEPAIFLNVGIQMMNKGRSRDALTFFQKTVDRFPEFPDGYYFRGISQIAVAAEVQNDDKAAGQKMIAAAKADLTKFIAMAPNAPEAEAARKMLEQLK